MQRFLFDRLCQPMHKVSCSAEQRLAQLRESITEELQRLMTSRAFFNGLQAGEVDPGSQACTVLNFGINDLVSHSANFEESNKVKQQILKIIRHYEPRLLDPVITLRPTNDPLMPAAIEINGVIKADQLEVDFCWQQVGNYS